MHGTLVCHSWVVKNKICVALMGEDVFPVVTFALDTKQRKILPPSMAGLKTRNDIWE